MDDEPKPERNYPLGGSQLSKTPSWIGLGFLLGVAFVVALPKKTPPPAIPAVQRGPPADDGDERQRFDCDSAAREEGRFRR